MLIARRRRVTNANRDVPCASEITTLTDKHFILSNMQDGQFSVDYYPPRELVATEVLPTKNALGESPVWSDSDQALYWVS